VRLFSHAVSGLLLVAVSTTHPCFLRPAPCGLP